MYIRQALRVRGQSGLRRLGDEGRLGQLLSNFGRQSSLCNAEMQLSDKSYVGTCVLTANAFSAKHGMWDQNICTGFVIARTRNNFYSHTFLQCLTRQHRFQKGSSSQRSPTKPDVPWRSYQENAALQLNTEIHSEKACFSPLSWKAVTQCTWIWMLLTDLSC